MVSNYFWIFISSYFWIIISQKFTFLKSISEINKLILAILIESINIFCLFCYPIFIIVIMVFQRLISTKLCKDNTWYTPFMLLIKLYQETLE